jgi:hypothetical protein
MKIEVIIYTETNGQRNSVDHALNNIPDALKVVKKAMEEGKCMEIKVK